MEIEIKLTYKNRKKIISYLKQLSFKLEKTITIHDIYFNTVGSMSNTNALYRLRTINGDKKELTFKDGCVDSNGVWTRNEHNVVIDNVDKMAIILKSLGCILIKENLSTREVWKKDNLEFEFIDYQKPAKLNFIEIEGPSIKLINDLLGHFNNDLQRVGEEIFSVFDKN